MIENFTDWLKEQHYKPSTIQQISNYTKQFLEWLKSLPAGGMDENLAVKEVTYPDIMVYIKQTKRTNSIRLTNRKIGAVRKYYEWLKTKGETHQNPASDIYLKGVKRTVPSSLLKKEILDELYENYPQKNQREQRNKVMLGLLIYQGITTGELHRLEAIHIKLPQGKIEVPGSENSNGRTLNLESFQILELQEYLQKTRPNILKSLKKANYQTSPRRKPKAINYKKIAHQLFISESGSENLKPSLLYLFRELKKLNPEIRNATQIRQSTISYWLKTKDLRAVQYMAGHKYVSTTERYQSHQLEELEAALKQHHPLG